jgi:cytochrome c-type biogenesis protein CcmH/NrfG
MRLHARTTQLLLLALLSHASATLAQVATQPREPAAAPSAAASPDLARAEARYRSAIALDPTVGSYHASLAVILMRQGRLEEARQSAATAVRFDPTSPRSRAVFGEVLVAQRRWADAEPQLEEAIRLGSGDVLHLEALARAYAAQSKWALAASAYREALQLEPESIDAQRGYREALEQAGTPPQPLAVQLDWRERANDRSVVLTVFRILGGAALGIAAIGVLYPLVGFLYIALFLTPARLLRRSA